MLLLIGYCKQVVRHQNELLRPLKELIKISEKVRVKKTTIDKAHNKNTRRRQWHHSDAFINNFEQITLCK